MSLLNYSELIQLQRFPTPAVFNGWEQITRHDVARTGINLEPIQDFMPNMGPMVGYAVTMVIQPSDPSHKTKKPNAWLDYYQYVSSIPGPKILVVQDLDKPNVHATITGEMNAGLLKLLDCQGVIADGGVRDLPEVQKIGFKMMARQLCVGHGHGCPVDWNVEVDVFGCKIKPGQLIHADQHGFLAIPFGEEQRLLQATREMDRIECETLVEFHHRVRGRKSVENFSDFSEAFQNYSSKIKAYAETLSNK